MKVEFVKQKEDESVVDIIYNGKVYGDWYEDANVDQPEDLTLERDLSYLIEVGIEIGKDMANAG